MTLRIFHRQSIVAAGLTAKEELLSGRTYALKVLPNAIASMLLLRKISTTFYR